MSHFMGSSAENVLMLLIVLAAFGAIAYMVIKSIWQSRQDKKEVQEYVAQYGHEPSKPFIGPGNEPYRPEYDVDMGLANVVLATNPSLTSVIEANTGLSMIKDKKKDQEKPEDTSDPTSSNQS